MANGNKSQSQVRIPNARYRKGWEHTFQGSGSSAAEQSPYKGQVVGSNPIRGIRGVQTQCAVLDDQSFCR